jgi:predicted nucleic acid-binding protein
MQRAANGRLLVVCDACVLINLLLVGRLDLLTQNPDFQYLVTEHVMAEVTEPSQAALLAEAISQGSVTVIEVTDPGELATFAELKRFLGSGESAAVAAAFHRDLAIATDDGRTRREIEKRLGRERLLTTPGILLRLIRGGLLTVVEADEIKVTLESRRFRMSFASFADLI